MQGHDCLVLMPTGGGKSLCYQVPALAMEGTAVVISPLISLMHDQVEALKANGIPAEALNSGNDTTDELIIRRRCEKGELKLLYVSPENSSARYLIYSATSRFRSLPLTRPTVSASGTRFPSGVFATRYAAREFPQCPGDGAHSYSRQDNTRRYHTPASSQWADVRKQFRPPQSLPHRKTGEHQKAKLQYITRFISNHPEEAGIIYCLSRKNTEMVAQELIDLGINAAAYHAGMTAQTRASVQERFKMDQIQVVCATIAFGMGIDKSNVRWVIHYNMPKA